MKLITNLKLMKSIVMLVLVTSFTTLTAQNSTDKAVGILTFENETIDFGTIAAKENGIRAFKFTNTGNAPVVISQVKSSCGCTVASKPEKPVLPGETAQIEVSYDTKKIGTFSKSVTVISNAKEERMVLKIKGEIIKRAL